MKYICATSSNRARYVSQFIGSLQLNQRDGWNLMVSQEPMGEQDSVKEMIRNFGGTSWVNESPLGCDANIYKLCSFAFGNPDCEALVYFDDDMLLSPDAIELCDWYLARQHAPEEAGICLCNEASDPSQPDSISAKDTWRGLVCQGYCYTRRQWDDFVNPNFWVRHPWFGGQGYDWAIGHMAQHLNRIILRPRFSRTQHIGMVGIHGAAAGVHTKPFPEHFCQTTGHAYRIE